MANLFFILFVFLTVSRVLAQEWDASNYPNPTGTGYAQCNMKSPSMVCDPDRVLSESERYRLNYELNQFEALTRQPNGQDHCEKKGIVAGIAIAKHVRGGSENAIKSMSNDMLRRWTLDQQCSKSIVIVVSTEDRKFWAARDSRVPVYATEFTDIFNSQKPLFKDGRYGEALLNVLSETRQKALAKQTQTDGGGGSPFNPKNVPTYPDDYNRGKEPKPKGGMGLPKIPYWFWILLILVILPTLCCCCCLYFCCCRKKADATPRRQGPSDLPDAGGYPPSAPPAPRSGGGGLQGFLGGMGGAAIGNTIMGMFNRNRNGRAPPPIPADGGGGGGGFDDPPAYQTGHPGQRPGGPLYPSITVKDEGGGGGW